MQEIRYIAVNGREYPVLISDEAEALLAARAAGRAVVGLWDRERGTLPFGAAEFVVERPEDADPAFLERVVRRSLGLPWRICETKRLLIREICGDDFTEIWENQIGHGFGTLEELEAYTKHQYGFYGFGFWALVEKAGGDLVGVAGVTALREADPNRQEIYEKTLGGEGETLEMGYHVFLPYRRRGYGREACGAVMEYAKEELGAGRILLRIERGNLASERMAAGLGFHKR